MRRILKLTWRGAVFLVIGVTMVACALHIAQTEDGPLSPPPDRVVRLATWNVHYIWLNREQGAWSVGDWMDRREAVDMAFKALDADIVAFQEMESFAGGNDDSVNLARSWLLARNPGYAAAAVGDWRVFPSTQPIFFRKDRFEVLDQGWFFFSATPDVIYSRTFNGSYPAFASWADFERRGDGRRFRVYNVHFEYSSGSNRVKSAELVRDQMAPVIARGGPVFLLGDINAFHGSRVMGILEEAGLSFARVPGATYHADRGINLLPAIDHIGAAHVGAPVSGPDVLQRRYDGVWPSDHYPVIVDYRLP